MGDSGTSAALRELYNIAIQSLDELKLNSTATEYAVFCEEMEQLTRETMINFSKNRRRMESQYYNNHYPEHIYQPQPTFKRPFPLDPISENTNVSMHSRSNYGKKVNHNASINKNNRQQENKNNRSTLETSQAKIGIPPGVKLPHGNDWTSSDENSEDEHFLPKKEMKKKPNVTKKPAEKNKKPSKNDSTFEIVENKKKPSLTKKNSISDEATNSKQASLTETKKGKRQSLKEDKFEGIQADFALKNWSLFLQNKHLMIKGDQYDRELNLLKTNFVSSPITSAKKIQGKFVVKTRNVTYLLVESKMKDDENLPEEVKKFCKKEFPLKWRQCLTLWLQINQTLEDDKEEKKEKEIPEQKKQKNPPKQKKLDNKQKKNEKKVSEQKRNEPDNNGKSIFQKMMADDSLDAGNCMTPSALLNSIKKTNVSVGIHTPPSNFMRDLQSTSVFELSIAKSSNLKKKQNSKVVERMTKNIEKKGNAPVQNVQPSVLCEKVDFNKILPQVQETSTFCSDSELSSISD